MRGSARSTGRRTNRVWEPTRSWRSAWPMRSLRPTPPDPRCTAISAGLVRRCCRCRCSMCSTAELMRRLGSISRSSCSSHSASRVLPRRSEPGRSASTPCAPSCTSAVSAPGRATRVVLPQTSSATKPEWRCSSTLSNGPGTYPAIRSPSRSIQRHPSSSATDGTSCTAKAGRSNRQSSSDSGRTGATATRSSPSRMGWPRTTGTVGACSRSGSAIASSWLATMSSSPISYVCARASRAV